MDGLERGTVELEPYDPAWSDAYEAEVERLRGLAGDRIEDVDHVGSTAVAGLPAKPIIDLLAVVPDLEDADDLVALLADHGYEPRPDAGVPDRRFLAKGPRAERTHYLSLTEADSEYRREALAFRDALRADDELREEYADLKRELVARYPRDRDSYTAAKGAFVEGVLDDVLDDR